MSVQKEDEKDLLFYLIEFEKKAETVKFLRDACNDAAPEFCSDRARLENSYIDTRISQAIRTTRESNTNNQANNNDLEKHKSEKDKENILRHINNSTHILFEEIDGLFSDVLASLAAKNKINWVSYKTSIAPISKSIPACPEKNDISSRINRVKNIISEIEITDPAPSGQNLLDEFYWYKLDEETGWFSKHYAALSLSVDITRLLLDAIKAKHIYDEEQRKKAEEEKVKKKRFIFRISVTVIFGVLSLVAAHIYSV